MTTEANAAEDPGGPLPPFPHGVDCPVAALDAKAETMETEA